MYHYINKLGQLWIGNNPPPEDSYSLNTIWLHPTESGSPLWELLAFDCVNNKWVQVGGTGGGPGTFEAAVDTVESTPIADANVVLDGNTFKFSFGLPKGSDGPPGKDGPVGPSGPPGKDGINGSDGTNGEDGSSIRIMYAKTSTSTVPPIVVKDNPDPGSIWGSVVPTHSSTEFIWSITASFKNLILQGEWSDPIKMTGDKGSQGNEGPQGPAGVVPDWKVYVYKLSDSKPTAPSGTSTKPIGWADYPDTSGNWWQCIGSVNGTTGLVTVWSEVIPVNGRDGTAQDGKFTELRFAVNSSNTTPPALDKTVRTPSGWTLAPPSKLTNFYMWMTTATINPDDTLYIQWSAPVVISGEQGPPGQDGLQGLQGEKGEQGISGTNGTDGRTTYFHIKYSAIANPVNPSDISEVPNSYIGTYVDFTLVDSADPSDYTWARFEGIQGPKGEQGIPGVNGESGKTSYLHIKYSNDGGITFTGNNGEDSGDWIGQYTDFLQNDSNTPSDYKWSKIKGDIGPIGPTGSPGINGTSQYFHIKYSANANGSPMKDTPDTYIGTVVTMNSTAPTTYTSYTWARLEGAQGPTGNQGIPGNDGSPGSNGQTAYLHIKYSNDGGQTFTSNGGENVGSWIGQYVDFIQTDSTKVGDYKWAKIKGDQGEIGLTGPAGDQGPAGSQGVSGIPGVSIEVKYCLGTISSYQGSVDLGTRRNPEGWLAVVPAVTSKNPYIWFIQATIQYADNDDTIGTIRGTWSIPARLSGTNGLDGAPGQPGAPGSKGQLVYPAGLYDFNTPYTTTATKAPYVYDSGDANYWVLNNVMTWIGANRPSSFNSPSTDPSGSWVKLDAFEALYAKIGIIANGLIGSAVFNSDYMFSQQGIDQNGEIATNYEDFDPDYPTDSGFTPNILFNFKSGSGHLAAGKIVFDNNGVVTLTDLHATNIILAGNTLQEYTPVDFLVGNPPYYIESLNSIISTDANSTAEFMISPTYGTLELQKYYKGIIYNNSRTNLTITFTSGNTIARVSSSYGDGRSYLSSILIPSNANLEYMFFPTAVSTVGGKIGYSGTLDIINPYSCKLAEGLEHTTGTIRQATTF